ncbi:MAG: bifunctional 5,10-methylene-tetrahydrofolate dehydrogenase/5,10-methylene-tetrahydrofolate cyclohydrolase, partial [Eubacterium sp.]|nr:bifunctional 5,10-methylene-tetrahydrofolate dehydrogenase/5,10-methylene-tetrahydrofolate cyclohydrolase [Eubacterium sp.]
MATRLAGKPVSDALQAEIAERIEACRGRGVKPAMLLIRVGEREDDLSYERTILKRCEKLGILVQQKVFPADCTQEELTACIREGNADAKIHGIMMFRPLPKHLDEQKVIRAIDYRKDIDSVTRLSMAGIY